MNNTELIEGFFAGVGAGDIGSLSPLLADDFVYEDQTAPTPLNREQFLAWVANLTTAVPDLSLDAHGITAVGDDIVADLAIAGTVTGALDLAVFGQGVVPPSDAAVALAPQPVTFAIADGLIASCQAEAIDGGGIGGLIEAVGGLATAPV